MHQFVITPAAGKRLIAKATAEHPLIMHALEKGTVVIIAGTTNGYLAEELLQKVGQSDGFRRDRFFRGVTLPPKITTTDTGRLPDESQFPGDVVVVDGVRQQGTTIFDIAGTLKEGDVIIKGANCVKLPEKKAGVLIGHPAGGTIAASLGAVVGRRVKLILPVGLEKRVTDDIDVIAALLNEPGASGPRLLPVQGEVITELDALQILYGVTARLVAGGGVGGAEGAVWIAVEGDAQELEKTRQGIEEILKEPVFSF